MRDGGPRGSTTLKTAVFVISLKGSSRRARFAASAAQTDLPWSFFDARTAVPPDLVYDVRRSLRVYGRELDPGELGCYASHFAVWKEIVAQGLDQAVVLEDDAIADWTSLERFCRYDLSRHRIRLLKLHAKLPPPHAKIIAEDFVVARERLVKICGYTYSSAAYVVTREGAAFLTRNLARVVRPVDDAIERGWEHGMPTLCVYPHPVHTEDGFESFIGNARFSAGSHGPGCRAYALADKIRRAFYRLFVFPFVKLS